MSEARPSALSAALFVAAVFAVLTVPQWSSEPSVTGKKTDEQIEDLEREQKRLADKSRELEARLIHVEDLKAEFDSKVDRLLPANARWIPLRPGGSDQWDFPVGGRVQVQFLHLGENGVPTFRVKHRAAEVDVPLAAAQTMRAVDDLGEEQRVYSTTLHRLRLDRTGRPDAALISIVVSVER